MTELLRAWSSGDDAALGALLPMETAEALHVSPDTVKRDWRLAKLWLQKDQGQHRRRNSFESN